MRFPTADGRGTVAAALMVAGAAGLLVTVCGHYALADWLVLKVGAAWLLAAALGFGVVGSADAILRRTLARGLPIQERLVFSGAVGLFGLYLLLFAAGLLHLYGSVFFVLVMVASCAFALGANRRYVRRLLHLRRHLRGAGPPAPRTPVVLLIAGVVALLVVYYRALSPDHASFDARWYHLPIATHYVAGHGISRFPEGWYLGAYPHLSSLVYAWAYMEPTQSFFERTQLASHLELLVFCGILASIPPLVRRLGHGARRPGAWVALFLFPAIFAHDGNLSLGADHFAAFWTIPILLSMLRLWSAPRWQDAALFAIALSGMASTKYSALIVVAPASLVLGARLLWLAARPAVRGQALRALGLIAGLCAVLTAPHWLKNLLWYGDPLYPALNRWFAATPWSEDARPAYENFFRVGSGVGTHSPPLSGRGLLEAARTLASFSFVPHDWAEFHRDVPIFGSLFTLLLPVVPLVSRPRRLVGLYAFVHLGLLAWLYVMSPQDRFLQCLLPAMAALTAAVIAAAWSLGPLARGALVLLLGVQIAWGLDVPFLPTNNLAADGSNVRASELLVASGFRKNFDPRRQAFDPYLQISKRLPPQAKVLVHEVQATLGLGREMVNDSPADQALIAYARYRTARDVHAIYRSLGVTHLVWGIESAGRDSLAGELVFLWFAGGFTTNRTRVQSLELAALPPEPPPPVPVPAEVAVLGCNDAMQDGLYRIEQLATSPFAMGAAAPVPRPLPASAPAIPAGVGFLLRDARCKPERADPDKLGFVQLTRRAPFILYGRRP